MPFTKDGIRPDLIINPHALPTRMTIGQLVECIIGKAGAMYGGFGDCTAFNTVGTKVGAFGELLAKQGFHSSGNEVLYNGMTGQQMESEIFMGPTFYMRLKHMVKDKVNYRALGPRTALTKQPVGGRANDGGLRIGEMERDTLISHGMSDFLRESMMERGDKSYLAVCNLTGMISIYNPAKGLFMSPMADGPLRFTGSFESDNLRVEHITKYGRNFSVVCIPYSLKLMVQELLTIGVQMRIMTEDTIEQMENMSYSNNVDILANQKISENGVINTRSLVDAIKQSLAVKRGEMHSLKQEIKEFEPRTPETPFVAREEVVSEYVTPPYIETSPAFQPSYDEEYLGETSDSPQYNPNTPPLMSGGARHRDVDTEDPDQETEEIRQTDFPIGKRIMLRAVTDGYPARPWQIVHEGDQFLTIKAEDETGLSDNTRVVSKMDVFPWTAAALAQRSQPSFSNPTAMSGPPPPPSSDPAPTIIHFSPTLVNGTNNTVDQTTEPTPPSNSGSVHDQAGQGGDMVIRHDITPSNEPEQSGSEPDLSKTNMIVIKKLG
jgi:hypothetical protein